MRRARIFLILTALLAFAFLAACGGGSSNSTPPQTIAPSGGNVASITVNGGPAGNYVDASFYQRDGLRSRNQYLSNH